MKHSWQQKISGQLGNIREFAICKNCDAIKSNHTDSEVKPSGEYYEDIYGGLNALYESEYTTRVSCVLPNGDRGSLVKCKPSDA